MTKRLVYTRVVLSIFCLGLIVSFPSSSAAQRKTLPRNVLLIVADDLNTGLGCYGNRTIKSPNVDRLAARGVRFERAYCQYPVCNPSRSSFLSGLRPEQTGILDNTTPLRIKLPGVVTLPQLFRQRGWFTAQISKIFHVSQWDPPLPSDKPGTWRLNDPLAWDFNFNTKPSETGKTGERLKLPYPDEGLHYRLIAEGGDDDQEDGRAVAEAVRLMAEKRDKPFFIGVGLRRPHAAWIAPKKYFDFYPKDKLKLPTIPPGDRADKPAVAFTNAQPNYSHDAEMLDLLQGYYAGVTFMDAQVGRLLDALERLKLADSTIVVLFGDHGFHLGEHGLWHKDTLFEESARLPLIIAVPGAKGNGQASPRVVELVDLFPTLADLAGLNAPAGLAGRSLRPLLDEPERSWSTAAFTVVKRRDGGREFLGRSVRTERWRYTEWDEGRKGVELYDHERDPHEHSNLSANPKYAPTVAEMERLLRGGGRR